MKTNTWNVPYHRNPCFTGREQLLIQLHTILQAGKPLALSGLGGIGKTQTVVEYAYRYRSTYQAVLWIRADTRDTLTSDYLSIAPLVKLSENQDEIQRIAGVKLWLETHNGWLLIFDNADDLDLLAEFLPITSTGHILLTTRTNMMKGIARKIDIAKLEPGDGALFLLRRTGMLNQNASLADADTADIARAEEISRTMDGLPLALDQAGAYIEERRYGLSTYLTLYKKSRAELLKDRGGSNPDHPESVATTLFLSFRNVEQASSSSADLLRFCAFLAPDAIPEELLLEPDGWLEADHDAIQDELEEAVSILQRYSLIQQTSPHEEQPTYTLHRLVQAALRDDMNEQAQGRWIERIASLLNRAFLFDYKNVATWSRCGRLLPHALVCMEHCKQRKMYNFDFLEMCKSVLAFLHHLMRDVEAEVLAQQIYDIDVSIFASDGQDHALISSDLNNHALILEALHRYPDAETLFERALHMRERLFGRNHSATADVIHDLANLYAAQGFFEKAEQLHWEALSIRLDAENVEKEDIANSNHNLGNIYSLKDYGQAEKYYQQSLAFLEKEYGSQHPNLAVPLQNLGLLYESKGQYSLAQATFLRALAIQEATPPPFGPDHPNVAKMLICLANLYKIQERFDEAEPLYKRALAIYDQALEPDHPDRVIILVSLASFYQYQGRYEQAEPLYMQARTIREKIVGPNHPNVAKILVSLGLLYTSQQKYDQAHTLLQQALTIREQTFGYNHPDVADTLYFLALLSTRRNDPQKAESLYSRALRIFEKVYGHDHPDVARSLMALVDLLSTPPRKYYNQAVLYLERILTIYEKTLVSTHQNITETLRRLAQMYHNQGIEDTAIKYYRRAIALHKKSSEVDELEVIPYLEELARVYIHVQLYPKAEELYKQALTLSERALVPNEPLIISAHLHLVQYYTERENYPAAEQHYKMAIKRSQVVSGRNHIDTLNLTHDLALTYVKQHAYEKAANTFQRVLKGYEAIYDAEHEQIADISRLLGNLYYDLDKYKEASIYLRRALSIYEKDRTHDALDIARILLFLAESYRLLEQDEKARPFLQRRLKLCQDALGPDHPDVALSLTMLADLYSRQKQYAQAFPLYREALRIREADPTTSKLELFQILTRLADLYQDQDEPDAYRSAEALYRRALPLLDEGITPEKLTIVMFFASFGDCCVELEMYEDGANFYQQALEMCKQIPDCNPTYQTTLERVLASVQRYLP